MNELRPEFFEPDEIYSAILHLRRAGISVYRQAGLHIVSGKALSDDQLIELAAHTPATNVESGSVGA